jgi:uncharacterized protein (TIGR03000 family)
MLSRKLPWHQFLLVAGILALPLFSEGQAQEPVAADKAILVVRLPAGANLTVDDNRTKQTGAERVFVTPPLPPGKDFKYTLKATWRDGDRNRVVMREAAVRAGSRTTIDFNKPERLGGMLSRPGGAILAAGACGRESMAHGDAKSRSFLFTYGTTVTGLPAGKVARVWLPVPNSSAEQDVQIVSKELPGEDKISREPKFGNQILYLEAKAGSDGKLPLEITYRVTRREVKANLKEHKQNGERLATYLQPDALVPIGGKPLELIKDRKLPSDQLAAARVLYYVVNDHMRYSKEGKGWGRGDAVWACESRSGNCSDFHSLFISLARARRIPAKFEIGFPLPTQHGAGEVAGYHCWAKFHPSGHSWVPVDISEANKNPKLRDYYFGNLSEDRITFSTGRDLELVPKQDGQALNFFIYPYVEVDGKPYPDDKVQRKFSYQDVPAEEGK